MTDEDILNVHRLTEKDLYTLDAKREVVRSYIDLETSEAIFSTPEGKMQAIDSILGAGIIAKEDTARLECLGTILGDVFVDDLGFHWVVVDDEIGRDFAIMYKETGVVVYPLTLISKRIQKGDTVDVYSLYHGLVKQVQERVKNSG